jgi:hypothetical protein
MLKPQNYFQSRYNSGKINEEHYKPIIEKYIKEKLHFFFFKNLFDFENENFKIKLKTRDVNKENNLTTIIGYDKLKKV